MTEFGLATALGLRPLDRIQLNNAREIREMRMGRQLGYTNADLPFLYFQRVRANGLLELRSPSGYPVDVAPADICDIRPGEPVLVQAMPRQVFLKQLALPVKKRGQPPGPECFADAHVLWVCKDKWGEIDQCYVWFLDPSLNDMDRAWNAPFADGERERLAAHARRTIMPVGARRNSDASFSADHGVARQQEQDASIAKSFFRAAMEGNRDVAQILLDAGVRKKKVPRALINNLGR